MTEMKRVVTLLALLATPAVAAADDVPREMFAQLVIGDGKEQAKFAWPEEKQFEQIWRSEADVIRVLEVDVAIAARGENHKINSLLIAVWPMPTGLRLIPLSAKKREQIQLADLLLLQLGDWKLQSGSLDDASKQLRFVKSDASMDARVVYLSPKQLPAKDGWTAWSYAATLLASDPPIDNEFTPPMGRCSMDSAPQEEAAKYADACYDKGRLGCYLQLQVRIMGDRFARVAQSSYGEEAHGTEVARLERAGIDAERFLVGLSYQFAVKEPREELWPWRFARAVNESARSGTFEKALEKIISDPTIDEYNRVRATQTLAYRKFRLQGEARDARAIKSELSKLPLSPASRMWLDGYIFSES